MARAAGRSDAAVKAAKPADTHKIELVDQTKPISYDEAKDQTSTTTPETDDLSRRRSKGVRLSKKLTQSSMKEELAQRKYAKWKRPSDDGAAVGGEPEPEGNGQASVVPRQSTENTLSTMDTTKDRNSERGSSLAEGANLSTIRTTTSKGTGTILTDAAINPAQHDSPSFNPPTSAIDILYENQRGYFFFGIPFFSCNSLLNFDPPAWVTANGGPSPVDIQTAQVPDPSWAWAWPSWYIDMANDVDEEGWQYSFAFFRGLAWHGTHPWFHSFVRRRRWIRKRVRRREILRQQQEQKQRKKQDSLRRQGSTRAAGLGDEPGMLDNADTSGQNGKSIIRIGDVPSGGGNARRTSGNHIVKKRLLVGDNEDDNYDYFEDDESNEAEIRHVHTLIQRLRYAAVDREKIGTVKLFLRNGSDDEIARLTERVSTSPEYISFSLTLMSEDVRMYTLSLLLSKVFIKRFAD